MNTAGRQAHWENIYRSKGEHEVSWFQESPAISLDLIHATGGIQRFQFSRFQRISDA